MKYCDIIGTFIVIFVAGKLTQVVQKLPDGTSCPAVLNQQGYDEVSQAMGNIPFLS